MRSFITTVLPAESVYRYINPYNLYYAFPEHVLANQTLYMNKLLIYKTQSVFRPFTIVLISAREREQCSARVV